MSRPSFEPNVEYLKLLLRRSGKSISDFATACGVGEKTLRDMLKGAKKDGATLQLIAVKLKLTHWHELISDAEKASLGLPETAAPTDGQVGKTTSGAMPTALRGHALGANEDMPTQSRGHGTQNPGGVTSPTASNAASGSASPAPSFTGSRLHQLPGGVADFVGREDEFARITERLRAGGGSVGLSSHAALRGLGGVGKTSLAIKAAHAVAEHFQDGQLVLNLQGTIDEQLKNAQPLTSAAGLARVIRDFHPEAKLPDTVAELLPIYYGVLHGKRVLILLDNARDEEQVKDLLSAPSPTTFLVTSRRKLDGVESVPLDVFSPARALEMLRGIVKSKGTDVELLTVAELCGRLPLALQVAGDFLGQHPNWSTQKYIEELRDEEHRLESMEADPTKRKVETVLALSAKHLIAENADRAERWQMLSVFPADFDELAAAAVWEMKKGDELDRSAARKELTCLMDWSLVQFAEGRFSLHDLMRPVARNAFAYGERHPRAEGTDEGLRGAERRFAEHYRDVLAAADELYLKGGDDIVLGLALFDREEANIRHGQGWAAQHRADGSPAAKLCGDFPNVGVYVINLRLTPRERIAWLETAVESCRTLDDRQSEGCTLGNLGIAHADLGDARTAIGLFERRLAIAREIGDRRGEENALGGLGTAHAALGDSRVAIGFYEQALAIDREIGDRRGEAADLCNLGLAQASVGDTRTAIVFYEQALVIAREIGDRRGEGSTLGNLGLAHAAVGDGRTAIVFHEQALVIAREIGDRRGEGNTLGNLGLARADLGDARTAIGFYKEQLVVVREIGDRRGEGNALGNLGVAHAVLGDARTASGYFELQLAIAREIGDQRGEGIALFNMALALVELGDIASAIPHAEHALAIFVAIESPNAEQARRLLDRLRSAAADSPN